MLDLNVKRFGESDSPVLLMLHGLFGSSVNWTSIARGLADRYRLIVPDLRNHGQSPHDSRHDYPAMVADLLRLLDAERVERVALVGHSMGGKVAMQLALHHRDRVDGLAVVDMAPVSYTHDFQVVLDGFAAVDLAAVTNRADADRQMAARVELPGVRAFLLQNLVKQGDDWGWRMNIDALAAAQSVITGFPEQPADARYEGPCSFIYGELSDYVTPGYEPVIKGYFPAASLCPVSGAGHWVYAEQPQGFASCLARFLEELPEELA